MGNRDVKMFDVSEVSPMWVGDINKEFMFWVAKCATSARNRRCGQQNIQHQQGCENTGKRDVNMCDLSSESPMWVDDVCACVCSGVMRCEATGLTARPGAASLARRRTHTLDNGARARTRARTHTQ